MPFKILQYKVKTIIENNNLNVTRCLTEICELLKTSIIYYDWIGFYFADQEEKSLHLKAYAGERTDHTIIAFGKGICGQVAISNKNFVVKDVKSQSNYLACSIKVKAEIVIPLFKNGKNIVQIDIDSHTLNSFSQDDEDFLVWLNDKVSGIL